MALSRLELSSAEAAAGASPPAPLAPQRVRKQRNLPALAFERRTHPWDRFIGRRSLFGAMVRYGETFERR
jgi:hypothetical protein